TRHYGVASGKRTVHKVWPAAGLDHLRSERRILGDHGARGPISARAVRAFIALRAVKHGRVGAAERCGESRDRSWAAQREPLGTASGGDGFVQPKARSG